MWILSYLPDSMILWATNTLLIAGVLATIISFFIHRIGFLYQYQLAFKIAGILFLVAGVYLRGGYGIEMAWRERVADLEAKIVKLEADSKNVNTQIETKVVYRTKIVRVRGDDIVRYITNEVVKYDTVFAPGKQCEIPREFIQAHNQGTERVK